MELEDALERIIRLRNEYIELYNDDKLISLEGYGGIHIPPEMLYKLPGKTKREETGLSDFPYRLSKEYEGTIFFSLVINLEQYTEYPFEGVEENEE